MFCFRSLGSCYCFEGTLHIQDDIVLSGYGKLIFCRVSLYWRNWLPIFFGFVVQCCYSVP
jgi:hypothetical protein